MKWAPSLYRLVSKSPPQLRRRWRRGGICIYKLLSPIDFMGLLATFDATTTDFVLSRKPKGFFFDISTRQTDARMSNKRIKGENIYLQLLPDVAFLGLKGYEPMSNKEPLSFVSNLNGNV